MLQFIYKDKIFWHGNIKEVASHIKKLSKKHFYVKDLIKENLPKATTKKEK